MYPSDGSGSALDPKAKLANLEITWSVPKSELKIYYTYYIIHTNDIKWYPLAEFADMQLFRGRGGSFKGLLVKQGLCDAAVMSAR